VTYELHRSADTARLVVEDLANPHQGVRLYVAWGTVGPVDGQNLDVLEVGTSWSEGRASLCVTVPQSGRPELLARLDVAELEPGDAEQVIASLLAAAGDAETRYQPGGHPAASLPDKGSGGVAGRLWVSSDWAKGAQGSRSTVNVTGAGHALVETTRPELAQRRGRGMDDLQDRTAGGRGITRVPGTSRLRKTCCSRTTRSRRAPSPFG